MNKKPKQVKTVNEIRNLLPKYRKSQQQHEKENKINIIKFEDGCGKCKIIIKMTLEGIFFCLLSFLYLYIFAADDAAASVAAVGLKRSSHKNPIKTKQIHCRKKV